jgi:hypothetical protein
MLAQRLAAAPDDDGPHQVASPPIFAHLTAGLWEISRDERLHADMLGKTTQPGSYMPLISAPYALINLFGKILRLGQYEGQITCQK